jgi:hypothetical protein
MDKSERPDKHYQVVRFFNDYIAGEVEQIVAKDLTLEEANQIFASQCGQVPDEDVVIVDQDKIGDESEVKACYSPRPEG